MITIKRQKFLSKTNNNSVSELGADAVLNIPVNLPNIRYNSKHRNLINK